MTKYSLFSAVRPLYYLSKTLGLAAFSYDLNLDKKLHAVEYFQRKDIIWPSFMILIILSCFVFRMLWNFVLNPSEYSSNVIVTTTLSRILLYGACLTSLVLGATVNRRIVVQILNKVANVDSTLLKDTDPDKIYRKTFLFLMTELVILISLLTAIGYYDIYVWGSGYNFIFEIMDDYAHLLNVTVAIQLINFVQLLKQRFTILNGQLSNVTSSGNSSASINVVEKTMDSISKVIRRSAVPTIEETVEMNSDDSQIQQMNFRVQTISPSPVTPVNKVHSLRVIHSDLYDVSEMVNENFGFSLLMELTYNFIDLVSSLYFTMDVIINNLKEVNQNPDSIHHMLSSTVWAVVCVVKIVSITSACHTTSVEAQKTSVLVHKLLLEQDLALDTKAELQLFAAQLSNTKVVFTAHGFFSVNFALLYGIIEAAATYIIILLQFRS